MAFAENQLRQPLRVEPAGAGRRRGLLPQIGLRVRQITRGSEVRVDRFTRDEQPHDLTGPFEDPVDPQVPHHLLHWYRPLTARGEGFGGLVSAATADL